MFGDLIYKECPRCKGLGYYEPEWNDSVYRTSFLLLDQFKDGWKAINGEYYWCASDIMQTYRVKRKYNV